VSTLFPNTWTIARREYEQRVRSRVFVIVTALLAVVGIGLALLPLAIRGAGGDEPVAVAVYSADARLASESATSLAHLLAAGQGEGDAGYRVTAATSVNDARADVRAGRLEGLLTITRGADDELSFDIFTEAGPASRTLLAIHSAADQINIGDRLARAGIDAAQAGEIFAPTPFSVTPLEPAAPDAEKDPTSGYLLVMALVVLTFMAVVTYGNWVASSVAEEKSSRVMELLITAATPRQLLAGKVLGTGAAGLTQYLAIVVAAIIGLLFQGVIGRLIFGGEATDNGTLQALTPLVLGVFGIFFLGGFALYATMYAALGSTASRQEDVQTVTGPMIVVAMIGYLGSFAALNVIDASWVRVVSFIPFFSPYLIPARLIIGKIAPWEIALAVALLLGALVLVQSFAARLYSAGVLLYGQRVGIRAVWRATRVHR
jgi:ABC-2 type transport system permease protein